MLFGTCTTAKCSQNIIYPGQNLCKKCTSDLARGQAARYREDPNHPQYNKGGRLYKKACRITHGEARYSTPEMRKSSNNDDPIIILSLLSTAIIGIVSIFFMENKKKSKY